MESRSANATVPGKYLSALFVEGEVGVTGMCRYRF